MRSPDLKLKTWTSSSVDASRILHEPSAEQVKICDESADHAASKIEPVCTFFSSVRDPSFAS